ncbi:MAG: WD40/YVTN/BNR-like repeat-containing protein, partial [Anaerolineae bacterium]
FPIDFQVDPRDSNRLFANNYGGGNFVSSDDGRTWAIASQGYTGAQVRDIAVDPAAGGRVFAAARSGLFVSRNGGSAWTGLNTPPAAAMEWYVVALDPMDAQHVLAANNWNGTILESNNGGQAWRQASQPTGEGKSWRAIVFAPADPQTVYAGTSAFYSAGTFDARLPAGGVYVSHDSGAGWQAANASLSQDANITALVVDPQNTLVVYAATGNRGLLKTSDGGQSWTAVTQDLPDSQPLLSIAHHPSAPVLFVGLEQAGLYRSDDGGLTWQPADAGLNPESSISDIIFDPTNAQVLYAADKLSGVYRSDDGGNIWTAVNDGLRNRSVNALAMPVDGRHLYAATEGEGVFRLDLAGSLPPLPDSIAGEETVVPPTPAQAAVQPEGTPVVETGPAAGTQIPAWPIIGGAAVLLLALLGLFWRFRRRS